MQFNSTTSCTMRLSQRGFGFICELEGCTDPNALSILRWNLQMIEGVLNKKIAVPVTQSQFDVLISLGYSIGIDTLTDSLLFALINKKRHEAAADMIRRWIMVDGAIDLNLKERREKERAYFKGEI